MPKNKRFDAVALMRRIRDKMSKEIKGMSYEEEKRYLRGRLRIARSVHPTKHNE